MADPHLRQLERAAAGGDPEAQARYQRSLRRVDRVLRHVPSDPARDPCRDPWPGDVVFSAAALSRPRALSYRLVTGRLLSGWGWRPGRRGIRDAAPPEGVALPPDASQVGHYDTGTVLWVELDAPPNGPITWINDRGLKDARWPRRGRKSGCCQLRSWVAWARRGQAVARGDGLEVLSLQRCRVGEHCLDGTWCDHYEPHAWSPVVSCCLCGEELARASS